MPTWTQLLAHWPLIDADLHDVYGIDTGSGILRHRRASWLTTRVLGLLTRESRIAAAVMPREEPPSV